MNQDSKLPLDENARLMRKVADGDIEAYKRLYQSFAPLLMQFFVIRGVGRYSADDFVQKIFSSLWKQRKNFRGDSSFETYLSSIARNTLNKEIRQSSKIVGTNSKKHQLSDGDTYNILSRPEADDRGRSRPAAGDGASDLLSHHSIPQPEPVLVPGESDRVTDVWSIGKWLESPLGWARANVIYETSAGPPKPGTLAEAMFMIVWKARQAIEVAGTKATAQAAIGGEAATEAFSHYRDLVNRVEVEDRSKKMREALEHLKEIKEIQFRPIEFQKKVTSLKTIQREDTVLRGASVLGRTITPITSRRPVRAKKR